MKNKTTKIDKQTFQREKTMIAAVYVTYNPDIRILRKSLDSITKQVDKIILVDNGSGNRDLFKLNNYDRKIKTIWMEDNLGIGAAQNIGITKAMKMNADYILLSDQDSIYPDEYIHKMLPAIEDNESAVAIAPKYQNVLKEIEVGFVDQKSFRFKNINPEKGIHAIAHAMASGMLLKAKHISTIGLMNEELFIDWVDLEWCWRANSLGFDILGNADVKIQHQIGYEYKKILKKKVCLHNPERHYYITRNALYLSLYAPSLSYTRSLLLFLSSIKYLIFYPILSAPHLVNLKAVVRGFYHGATKRLGRDNNNKNLKNATAETKIKK